MAYSEHASTPDGSVRDEYGSIIREILDRNGRLIGSVSLSSGCDISKFAITGLSENEVNACRYLSGQIIYSDFAKEILRRICNKEIESGYTLEADALIHIYYLKKYILMAQYYFNIENLDFTFPDVDPLNGESLDEIGTWCVRRIGMLLKIIPQVVVEEYFDSDYELYTDVFYHRKFWNEIPNDPATNAAFNAFRDFIEDYYKTNGSRLYEISLYDYNDESISFDTQKSAMDFINKFDCCPYTLFKIENGVRVELFSA